MGATRLAPKVKGIPEVGDLRPITLLNSDYKILSKVLVKRMKPALPSVISSSQLCTVGDKNILFGVNNILSSIFYVKSKKQKACLLSLDFFKAYDRVVLDYLLKVMEKMNFSPTFCEWIQLMHDGAMTRFLLNGLSKAIEVQFSIRQGDPLAMILYIIYIEPLLLYLERNLEGIKISGFSQKLESYCDDVNVLTEHLSDIIKVDVAVQEFEAISGAILSRKKKCKILGFGQWKSKTSWPINYLQSVEEVKVFGVFIKDSYKSISKRNWEYRFYKFNQCIQSWSSRNLGSLSSRTEVLKVFALSRVYYLASILPISKTMIHRFESLIGKFIWKASGWLLRVSMEEIKNSPENGGLGMVCVNSMCRSLQLTQFLRLLKSADAKSIAHIDYWIGDSLFDLLSTLDASNHPTDIHDYYCSLESLVFEGKIGDFISATSWRRLTNKMVYKYHSTNFPTIKVQTEAGSSINYKQAFRRITSATLTFPVRDVCYLLLHNMLTTNERLFRIGLRNDPYCAYCPAATTCDIEHFFCSCVRVTRVWRHVKFILDSIFQSDIDNWSLINFFMPKHDYENEAVWLVGNYVALVWKELYVHDTDEIKEEEFFGFLSFKFREDQRGSRIKMRDILL